jgi:hypothetical protein
MFMQHFRSNVQGQEADSKVLCGLNVIAFRKDGLALAAYSRISGYVYIWTLQPAWASRMSVPGPPKSTFQKVLSAGAPHHSTPVLLEPFRVMAAPAVPQPVFAPDPKNGSKPPSSDLSFSLVWDADGRELTLKRDGQTLGIMTGGTVQCP